MSCYLVQEVDGIGRFTLENDSGFLVQDGCIPVPEGDAVMGGKGAQAVRGRRRLEEMDDAELLAVLLSEL